MFSEGRWGLWIFRFLVAMVPHSPRDLPEFLDEGCNPAFSSVVFIEPMEVCLLLGCPFMENASFEEDSPAYKVLFKDQVVDTRPVVIWWRCWSLGMRRWERIAFWRSGNVRDLVSHASSLDIDAAH